MCQHAPHDLVEYSDFEEIGDPRLQVLCVDAGGGEALVRTFRGFDVILNGLPWKYDPVVTKACVEAGISGLDVSTVESQWD